MFEDCYFWADSSIPEDERTMSVLCVKCRDKELPDVGWFWKGSLLGYGPFDFICSICGHVIYSPNHNKKENETKSD